MSWLASDPGTVRRLIVKDWQVYQKQLAGYVAGLLLALGLLGMGSPLWSAAGALLLLVLLIVVGYYAIHSSIMAERKLQTQPFVMSLPVAPMDVFWGKLIANLVIYLVPFTLVFGGVIALFLTTPRPDGAVPWIVVVGLFLLASFCISLCIAIAVDSEGWNIFAMLVLMTFVGPFLYGINQVDGVVRYAQTDRIVWTSASLGILAAELGAIAIAIAVAGWRHARKPSFL